MTFPTLFALLALIVIALFLMLSYSVRKSQRVAERLREQLDSVEDTFAMEQFAQTGGYRSIKGVTILIPALNECENLKQIIPRIPKTACGQELGVLIIDDGSSDDTKELAHGHDVGVISTTVTRGGGAALRLGYRLALAGDAALVVTMDADGQNRPEEIERLLEPILAGSADFVIGSRILGSFEKDDPVRLLGVRLLTRLLNCLIGTRLTDCSSGFRAIKACVLETVIPRLKQRQFYTPELNIEVAKSGFRIREVPISFLKRISGRSKKGNNFFYGLAFVCSMLTTWLRVSKRAPGSYL
jgi:glycosyltransferase involved in cell wall biosynthesis